MVVHFENCGSYNELFFLRVVSIIGTRYLGSSASASLYNLLLLMELLKHFPIPVEKFWVRFALSEENLLVFVGGTKIFLFFEGRN